MPRRSSLLVLLFLLACPALGQDRLPQHPRFERYQRAQREWHASVRRGDLNVDWLADGSGFTYAAQGKRMRFDVATLQAVEATSPARETGATGREGRRRFPQRGRQFTETFTVDGKQRAFYRDGNVWASDADGKNERPITTSGDLSKRVKFGTASWVYGEELGQRDAMGWSPDGRFLWFYRFDETNVLDYHLTVDDTKFQNSLYIEPYNKAGAPNAVVDLYVHDTKSGKNHRVDVRGGQPFDDGMGHYVYAMEWLPGGTELGFHRCNRLQNRVEFCAADPETGKVRTIVVESWLTGWTDNRPWRSYLDSRSDIASWPQWRGKALWVSPRSGYRNLHVVDLATGTTRAVTKNEFDLDDVVLVDLLRSRVYYTAWSGIDPYKRQLHVVDLDGTGERRITNAAFHHSVRVAPDGRHFVDTFETIAEPPTTVLRDATGKELASLATSDVSAFEEKGLRRSEQFEFLADDGRTKLYGMLQFPSDFDPERKYPVLVSVYAGPDSGGLNGRFDIPDPITELGYLVVNIASRGTLNRGKRFQDAVYGRLGVVEIDDQASGVRALFARPYVDATRVGIHGVSYGGYAAAMAILRHPDVFAAACASSSVTDWRNYDTIYTERFMGLPSDNAAGYDAGSAMTYAANLRGRLLLFYGTMDDNVHPANTYQLVRALQRAGKSHEVQIGPDQGHAGVNPHRMLEFFWDAMQR